MARRGRGSSFLLEQDSHTWLDLEFQALAQTLQIELLDENCIGEYMVEPDRAIALGFSRALEDLLKQCCPTPEVKVPVLLMLGSRTL